MLKPVVAALLVAGAVAFAPDSREQDWPFYGGDQGGTKYSPLTDVNASTVARLDVAWEWSPREKTLEPFGTRPGNFQVTPLMIDNVLYLSTPYNRVVALNADTGAELWAFDPKAYEDGQPPNGTGFVHRGVAAWRDSADGNKLRIFINSRYRLIEGEHAWPTQPFPTKPPAITEQGVTLDDAFDLTPALKAAAQRELAKYRIGPVFTPPTLRGTVQQPGLIGGANWGGGAFDPASGVLFVKATNQANIARLGKPDRSGANPRASEVDAELTRIGDTNAELMDGQPLLKPPYGHLVAIDLNRGAIKWRVPFGDTPSLRRHPSLKGVALPAALGVAGAPGVLATAGGLVIGGGGDLALRAIDAASGAEVWHAPLPRRVNGTPMTYRSIGGRQFVVATGGGEDASLVAFALDGKVMSGGRH